MEAIIIHTSNAAEFEAAPDGDEKGGRGGGGPRRRTDIQTGARTYRQTNRQPHRLAPLLTFGRGGRTKSQNRKKGRVGGRRKRGGGGRGRGRFAVSAELFSLTFFICVSFLILFFHVALL